MKVTWHDQVWWPILGICALRLTHPKCTHTPWTVNTHTPWTVNTHTPWTVNTHPEQWAAIYAAAPGEQLGVQQWVERALYIHSPHLQFLPAWDLNSQLFDYESDSLTIRPWWLEMLYKNFLSVIVLVSGSHFNLAHTACRVNWLPSRVKGWIENQARAVCRVQAWITHTAAECSLLIKIMGKNIYIFLKHYAYQDCIYLTKTATVYFEILL